jgi:hypothetical protein
LLRIGRDIHSKGLEDRLIKSVREAMMPNGFELQRRRRSEEKRERRGEGEVDLNLQLTVGEQPLK